MFNCFKRCCARKRCCGVYNRMHENSCCNRNREVLNINEINYKDLLQKIKEGAILIDVRTKQEFLEGHLEGAILMPYYEIYRKIGNIIPNKNQKIIVYCQNGGRSIKAYEILIKIGYSNVYNLKGGVEEV